MSLAAVCVSAIPAKAEARAHCYRKHRSCTTVNIGVQSVQPCQTYVVQRSYPRVVERVYVPRHDYAREVIVVEQPCYEERVYVQPAPRRTFSGPFFNFGFGLSFR